MKKVLIITALILGMTASATEGKKQISFAGNEIENPVLINSGNVYFYVNEGSPLHKAYENDKIALAVYVNHILKTSNNPNLTYFKK